jgi:hypothetical protein
VQSMVTPMTAPRHTLHIIGWGDGEVRFVERRRMYLISTIRKGPGSYSSRGLSLARCSRTSKKDSLAGWILLTIAVSFQPEAAPSRGQHFPVIGFLDGGLLNSPMDGEESGDGGTCSLGAVSPQMTSRQSLKALAETARAFAFRARIPPRPAHRSRTGGGSVLLGQMFQYEVAGCLSLVKRLERRAADLDRATALTKWTP